MGAIVRMIDKLNLKFSGSNRELGRRIGWVAMEILQAFSMGKAQSLFVKGYSILGKAKGQLLGFFITRQAGHLIVTAGAIA